MSGAFLVRQAVTGAHPPTLYPGPVRIVTASSGAQSIL